MKTKLKLIELAGMVLLNSCVNSSYYIPERKELRRIENIPYDKKYMKCTNKSFMYQKHLFKKGILSRLVVGDVGAKQLHMWVEVYNVETDTWHLIDPTWNGREDGWEIKKGSYPKRKRTWVQDKNESLKILKNFGLGKGN